MFWDKKKSKKRRRRKSSSARKKKTAEIRALEQFVVEEIELDAPAGPIGEHAASSVRKINRDQAPSQWLSDIKATLGWLFLWIFLIAASFYSRTLWPMDETWVLATAWEMWFRESWLVPMMNGQVQPEGPLLPWLVLAGWKLFGVESWWVRLIPAIFSLLNLVLLVRLANHLWPGRHEIRRYAPLVLLTSFFWAFYSTLALQDLLVVFFVQLSVYALLWTWRLRNKHLWYLLLAISMALGMLTTGPVFLIYVLPVALLGPFWISEEPQVPAGRWYGGIIKALVLASGLVAAWLIPASAATSSGTAFIKGFLYSDAVFRGLEIFSHGHQPWWWYLLLMPLLALPWSLWPLLWMRLWFIRRNKMSPGLVCCIAWGAPSVVLLSIFGFRQPQMLLPLYPAFALAATYLLFDDELVNRGQSRGYSTMSIPFILIGGIMIMMPIIPKNEYLPAFLWQVSPFVGFGVIGIGILLAWLPIPEVRRRIMNLAIGSLVLTVGAIVAFSMKFGQVFDITEPAQFIANAQENNIPIAHVGRYHGQFHFAGRLRKPIEEVNLDQASFWAASHRHGFLIGYENQWRPKLGIGSKPALSVILRDTRLNIWQARDIK